MKQSTVRLDNNTCCGYQCIPQPQAPPCGEPGWQRDKSDYVCFDDECATIRFACAPGYTYFANDCGAGCTEDISL